MSDRSERHLNHEDAKGVDPTDWSITDDSARPPGQKKVRLTTLADYPKVAISHGSFYHKVFSPYGGTGIEGTVTLGYPHVDSKRTHAGKDLDAFKSYLGGSAKTEIDAGLGWEITTDKHGHKDFIHKAWRPFWRNDAWHNAPSQQRYYWKSGETVKMSLHVVAPDRLQLTISDPGDHPKRCFSTIFKAPGFGHCDRQYFKRVDSIDQVGTEGKAVHRSHSRIDKIIWQDTTLAIGDQGREKLTKNLTRIIDEPPKHVKLKSSAGQDLLGGETVEINAANSFQKFEDGKKHLLSNLSKHP